MYTCYFCTQTRLCVSHVCNCCFDWPVVLAMKYVYREPIYVHVYTCEITLAGVSLIVASVLCILLQSSCTLYSVHV